MEIPSQHKELIYDKDVLLEILKQKLEEAKGLLSHYIRAYAIYLAITGGLLKFSLDANSTPQLTIALAWLGIACSVVAFVVCILGEKLRRSIQQDLSQPYSLLKVPVLPDNLDSIKYTTIIGFVFNFLCMGAWVYLLFG